MRWKGNGCQSGVTAVCRTNEKLCSISISCPVDWLLQVRLCRITIWHCCPRASAHLVSQSKSGKHFWVRPRRPFLLLLSGRNERGVTGTETGPHTSGCIFLIQRTLVKVALVTVTIAYSDSFLVPKGPSHTENCQVLWQSATVTLYLGQNYG